MCRTCGVVKEIEEFSMSNTLKGTRRKECRACRSAYKKAYALAHPEKHRIKARNGLIKGYGILPEDYNRMFEEQEGKCAICGLHQSNFNRSLAIDHCHTTGKVRMLLCTNCNSLLGMAKESRDILKKAEAYLTLFGDK
jgi:hypothetical protein